MYGTNLISRTVAGQSLYYLYNGHADVTALISGSAVVASYYYDDFGVVKEETGAADNPYRYSGYEYDKETELYNLKARFYKADIARFLQEDTNRGTLDDPLSLNLYTYCANNPICYFDPTGHGYVWNNYGEVIGTTEGKDYTDTSAEATATHGGMEGVNYYGAGDSRNTWDPNDSNSSSPSVSNSPTVSTNTTSITHTPGTSVRDSAPAGATITYVGGKAGQSTIEISGYGTLREGIDYNIGADGRAYYKDTNKISQDMYKSGNKSNVVKGLGIGLNTNPLAGTNFEIGQPRATTVFEIRDSSAGRIGKNGKSVGEWAFRIDGPHGTVSNNHVNLNTELYPNNNIVNSLDHQQIPNSVFNVASNSETIINIAKNGGKALVVAGVVVDGYSIYQSYDADGGTIGSNTIITSSGVAGSWAGGIGGAKLGAMSGATIGTMICPGLGTAIGGFVGGIGGGIIGAIGGRYAGEAIAVEIVR